MFDSLNAQEDDFFKCLYYYMKGKGNYSECVVQVIICILSGQTVPALQEFNF